MYNNGRTYELPGGQPEFWSTVTIMPDGNVLRDGNALHSRLFWDEVGDRHQQDDGTYSEVEPPSGWSFHGRTGQHGGGHYMHDSEQFEGGIVADLFDVAREDNTPVTLVLIPVDYYDQPRECDTTDSGVLIEVGCYMGECDCESPEPTPEGWVCLITTD